MCHSDDPAVLWHYISRYAPDASPETDPLLNKLVSYAIAYYRNFVIPHKTYREPVEAEVPALVALKDGLAQKDQGASPEDLQTLVYEIGKAHEAAFPSLKDWFKALYQILLGQDQGPRMGSFIALYGRDETITLIDHVLAVEDLSVA